MRISSKSIQQQWLATITQQQNKVANLQQQVSSGRRINSAVDDPVGAAQIALFEQGLSRLETYSTNADTAERRLSLEEISLNETTDVLNRVRELAIQGGGAGVLPADTRQAIAVEIRELLASLVDTANTQDGEGRYLFAGNRVETKPFELVGGLPVYTGDQGGRSQRIADDRLIQEADSGDRVFQQIRNGNGTYSVKGANRNTGDMFFKSASVVDAQAWVPGDYTISFTASDSYDLLDSAGSAITTGNSYSAGSSISFNGAVIGFEGEAAAGDAFQVRSSRNQDIFKTISRLANTLELGDQNTGESAAFQSRMNESLLDLDQSLKNINSIRSEVGARLNIIDRQRSVNEEVSLQIETSLSTVRDLDYASAISELQLRLLSLEAAQKSFAQTQRNSLFNFI